jgi:hypothetical protein
MATILELYKAAQASLGVDKISYAAGENAKTPYTTNDLKKADAQVLTADKFKSGRGGILDTKKYSVYTKKN